MSDGGGATADGQPAGDERIRMAIAGLIRRGVYRPHQRLPSDREVMAKFGASRTDVAKAMRTLDEQGLVIRRRRRRTYVAVTEPTDATSDRLRRDNGDDTVAANVLAPAEDVDGALRQGAAASSDAGEHPAKRTAAILPSACEHLNEPADAASPVGTGPPHDEPLTDAVVTPASTLPASTGRLIWQRLRRADGSEPVFELLKLHESDSEAPWLECRTISLGALPLILEHDLAATSVGSLLAAHSVLVERTEVEATLATTDPAARLLRLKSGAPVVIIDEIARSDREIIATTQWIRPLNRSAKPRPCLRFHPSPRLSHLPPVKVAADSDFEEDMFGASFVRFGHFAILAILAVFRR